MPQITNKQIWQELKSLCHLIRGNPDNREDLGLLGDVHENTKFRKIAVRFMWILVVAVMSLWGTIIAQTLMNNGGH